MYPFDTSRLDQALQKQQIYNENIRQVTIQRTWQWLSQNAQHYQIQQAYLFGSVTRPHQFRSESDVDLAVVLSDRLVLFTIIGVLSETLERDVDVIELERCHFADRIYQTGIRWTPITSSY